MAKVQKITGSQTSGHARKQHQVAMFRASQTHAIGTYHSKTRHGMNLLNAYDKRTLLSISQKGPEDMMATM